MALSAAEEKQLARLLDRVQWPLPKVVFEALMRKTISVPIELGVFAYDPSGLLQVLMLQRPADDEEFPPLSWHMPGTVVRDDETVGLAMQRLLSGELEGMVKETPEYAGIFEVTRGADHPRHALSLMYSVLLKGETQYVNYAGPGKFFPVSQLPESTLPHHRKLFDLMMPWATGW